MLFQVGMDRFHFFDNYHFVLKTTKIKRNDRFKNDRFSFFCFWKKVVFEIDPSLTTVNYDPSLRTINKDPLSTIVNDLLQRKHIFFWWENPRPKNIQAIVLKTIVFFKTKRSFLEKKRNEQLSLFRSFFEQITRQQHQIDVSYHHMYRSTPEILKFNPIPPFIFPLQSL